MNLSRRSILTGLIAAPAVIAIDQLMPVRLWVPTIYGDAVHDDWEGVQAWLKGERFNILPLPDVVLNPRLKHHGVIVLGEGEINYVRSVYYTKDSRRTLEPKSELLRKFYLEN